MQKRRLIHEQAGIFVDILVDTSFTTRKGNLGTIAQHFKERVILRLLITRNDVVSERRGFLSQCLGYVALFYCGTPLAFHNNFSTSA